MKYEEIMNRVTVPPEMRQRVLRNVEAARIQKRKRLMGQLTALAACLAIVLCGWLVWQPRDVQEPDVMAIPQIEEAASIDGCGPVRTYFNVVLPMLKPTLISVGILELMWVWNDYLLPYLVLDITKYRTIPIHVQYLKGSYGTVDLGATMAVIMMAILPIIIVYLFCQKYIIKGVAAGAVKG